MKIAMFHELPMGGARVAANNLGKYLKKDNTIDLYYVDSSEQVGEYINFSSVNYFHFDVRDTRSFVNRLLNDSMDYIKLYFLHKKIAASIKTKKYDLVFIHGSRFTQTPFIGRFLNLPKVYYCQETLRIVYEDHFKVAKDLNIIKYYYEIINRKIRKKIDLDNLKTIDLILTNSKFTQDKITNNYKKNSKVVYLGVNSYFFKPIALKKKYDFFFIGTKTKVNGYDILEKALKLLSINIKGKYHVGKKWISDNELLKIYNQSKMVINLEYNQPFGLIVLEAMSCSVPAIVLNDAAYKETVVNGENSFMINNPEELAEKINLILSNEDLAKIIGKNGRENVLKKWDWNVRIKEFNYIFEEFIR